MGSFFANSADVVPPSDDTMAKHVGAWWYAPPLQMWPIAARRCVVRNSLNGASLELSSGEYAALSACEGCHPLAEHEARVMKQLSAPPEHRQGFHALIQRCAQSGLLMPVQELVARLGSPLDAGPIALGGVAIRTVDRPKLLGRLLASAARLEANGAPKRRWLVLDDSRVPANEEANRATCRALNIEHIGHAESLAFERRLCAEFPQAHREIAWLLARSDDGEPTYGCPFNRAMLFFAGQAFLSVDDDAILEARRPAIMEPGFAVTDEADELLWYESEEALLDACPPLELDPVAEHARWLGLPLAAAWRRAEREAGALAAIGLRSAHARHFAQHARVLFTHNHACGDPGSSLLPLQLLALPRRSRQWLAAHPQAASFAFGRRINWRGQTRLRLTPERVLTFTTMTGIDNSRLLPPAARSHRSEDVLLGILAQCMYPSAWLVDLPFGLPHRREPAKQWLACKANFRQEPLHVLCGLVGERAPAIVAETAVQRLEAIGSLLLDFASASDATITDALRQHAADAGSVALFAIAEQLEDATLPAQWKALLIPWLKSPAFALDSASIAGRVLEPAEFRALAGAYGSAMLAWPQLWEFCRNNPS
jgi:hypothetical protein